LEGLKDKEADQQGNPFTPSPFLSFDLFGWPAPFSICSVGQWLEGNAESTVEREVYPIRGRKLSGQGEGYKASCWIVPSTVPRCNATLSLELKKAQTSLTVTHDKLDSKSKVIYFQMIHADEALLWLKNAESRLKAVEEDLKNQR
jgi:hypothetical protein